MFHFFRIYSKVLLQLKFFGDPSPSPGIPLARKYIDFLGRFAALVRALPFGVNNPVTADYMAGKGQFNLAILLDGIVLTFSRSDVGKDIDSALVMTLKIGRQISDRVPLGSC